MNPVLAIERLDTWVLRVSIAVPLVCVALLLLWHLASYLSGKLGRKRRVGRLAPEPPGTVPSRLSPWSEQTPASAAAEEAREERARRARELLALAREDFRNQRLASCLQRCQALAETFPELPEAADAQQLAGQIKNDPERLQRACAALVESLAVLYLELAECWSRQGQAGQAAAVWRQLVQTCPQTRQAQVARDRLRELGAEEHS